MQVKPVFMQTPSSPSRANLSPTHVNGFSLVEIAVVLVILTILLSIVVVPIATQVEQRRVDETQKFLESAKDALYGFAAANGRLPCPATATSAGQESFCTNASPAACGAPQTIAPPHGRCVISFNTLPFGLLPAVTLGITPVDAGGYALDAWADGSPSRRIGYAVSDYQKTGSTVYVLTAPDGIRTATMASVAAYPPTIPHLYVCATGLTATPPTANCGVSGITLTDMAPVVLFSLGKNSAANSFDETNNQNGDRVFTSGNRTDTFDDIVTWMSLNTLFDRMVKAGKLP